MMDLIHLELKRLHLVLNPGKCSVMSLGGAEVRRELSISVDGVLIRNTAEIEFLGVTFTSEKPRVKQGMQWPISSKDQRKFFCGCGVEKARRNFGRIGKNEGIVSFGCGRFETS